MHGPTELERVRQDLLDAVDFAFRRLRERVGGLTDEEYFWEPVDGCWSVRATEDGTFRADGSPVPPAPAPLTTIAWRLCHIIDVLAGERNATWLGVEPTGRLDRDGEPGTAAEATDRLEQAFTLFRTHVAATDPAGLTAAMGSVAGVYADDTRAAFVLHELDELVHHGAEVATMRDLYQATRPVEPFVRACLDADASAARSMLAADPALRDRHAGLVAQMAGRQHWPSVRLLVDLGFEVDVSAGTSALHYAAGAGALPVVRLLVEHGADRDALDTQFHLDPAGWARYFGRDDVARFLEQD
ncbi:DinB family protein [Actinophytocola oryzae]|uniref:DinB family protein n=1 Tax=Actinophytocola oryzae TaxID=502181 RepID=UPI001AAFF58D|nr:DinB family protein [Actinophytocola oryzae]